MALDLPAASLGESLARLSDQTGVSIGIDGTMPPIRVPALRGRIAVDRALERLLAGSGWRARRVGPSAWRLERAPAAWHMPTAPAHVPQTAPPEPEPREVIVTGRKRRETLAQAPAAIAVVQGRGIEGIGGAPGTAAIASRIDGLSITSLGSGRNRLFVRGVADSPFDGFGQASVSVAVDDARVTYDAPDPDLRLVDVDRVELLKGPQGPLYGTGALGGIYRIVTRRPDPAGFAASLSSGVEAVAHGGTGVYADAMVNLPIRGSAAARLVAYRAIEPGWIDTDGGGPNRNRGRVQGARGALHLPLWADWSADVSGMAQNADYSDSMYVDGGGTLSRSARMAEPHDADFRLATLSLHGRIGGLALASISSIAHQELRATYDASAAAAALGGVGPARYDDERRYRVLTQELRVSGPDAGVFRWLAGISLLKADTDAGGLLVDGSGSRAVLQLRRRALEAALFGEATMRVGRALTVALGGRLFYSGVDEDAREYSSAAESGQYGAHLAPSLSVAWDGSNGTSLYFRYADALRPGGAQPKTLSDAPGTYQADSIDTFEAGARRTGGALTLSGAIFYSTWRRVQADFLRPDGLVTTRNAGDAVNWGGEVSAAWRQGGWGLSGGLLLQRGRLTRVSDASVSTDDLRLPVVPDVAVRGAVERRFALGAWQGQAGLSATLQGPSRLSFDSGLDRPMPARGLLTLTLGADRGAVRLQAAVENLLDSHVDQFAFGNPFAARSTLQHTPQRPRTVRIGLTTHF